MMKFQRCPSFAIRIAFAIRFVVVAGVLLALPTQRLVAYQTLKSDEQPKTDDSIRVERFAPLSLDKVRRAIEVLPGYEIELVASEPLIQSPVAIDFDANGNLWVVEMVDYSEQENEALGRISRLSDTNGDGAMDQSTLIAENLSWPTALAALEGKVWVAAPPFLLQWSNLETEKILEGFGRQNVQGLANSFRWGIDGKLHLSTSSNGGKLQLPSASKTTHLVLPGSPYVVSGRDVAFDPRNGQVSSVVGYGQHGFDFGPWGDRFVTANSDHLQQVVAWYLPELTDASLSKSVSWRRSIAVDGPQAEVFRISPVESWRTIRTQMRLSGMSNGILEGSGQASGYFTSATGVTIYDGDQWQTDAALALIADVGSNLVHRKKIVRRGVASTGERIDVGTEFLRSSDTWFRPVQFANGPDGCLYIVDMARETIEHPKSIPEPIKSQVDLTSGRNLGRIWRVKATGKPIRRTAPNLSQASTEELCKLLSHPNGWHRETASRILIERQDLQAIQYCRAALKAPTTPPLGRLHALSVLANLPDGLDEASWKIAIGDPEPRLRVWGWVFSNRLNLSNLTSQSESFSWLSTVLRNETDPEVQMVAAVRSPTLIESPQVRAEVFAYWTGRSTPDSEQIAISEELRAAIEFAIRDQGAKELWDIRDWTTSSEQPASESFVDAIFAAMQRQGDVAPIINQWLERIRKELPQAGSKLADAANEATSEKKSKPNSNVGSTIALLGRQLYRKGIPEDSEAFRSIQSFAKQEFLPRVEKILLETSSLDIDNQSNNPDLSGLIALLLHENSRIGVIRILSALPPEDRIELFKTLLDSQLPHDVQRDWIEAWVPSLPQLQNLAVVHLEVATPVISQAIIKSLVRNESGATRLLDWVESPENTPSTLPSWAWQTLRAFPAESIRNTASRIAPMADVQWESVAPDYRKAWTQVGNAQSGELHFRKLCQACHRVGDVGIAIGPSLDSYRVRPNEAIGLAIAEPSREMDPKYEQQQIATHDGEVHVGILQASSSERVTLLTAQNQVVSVFRNDIETWKASGKSLMPDGLLKELDPIAMADLIAFLRKIPSLPTKP
jgi:putative membrane-bound dehydrogenase-like protein